MKPATKREFQRFGAYMASVAVAVVAAVAVRALVAVVFSPGESSKAVPTATRTPNDVMRDVEHARKKMGFERMVAMAIGGFVLAAGVAYARHKFPSLERPAPEENLEEHEMAISKVGVIGCGLMGQGIAQVAAQGGFDVTVVETDQKFLDGGLARIDKSLAKFAEKAKEKGQPFDATAVRGRIVGSLDQRSLADRDLVVEAIVEDLDAKKQLFAELGRICKPDAILASNTSSFPIAEMARASGRPKQVVGLHFFNPVQLMKLVEVVRTSDTTDEVFATARAFGEACGKTPIACQDTPGFVVNRLLVPYMVQSLRMLERGDAAAADIDTAMKLGCGHPMGPIELTDYVGLDTTLAILKGWVKAHPKEPAFAIPAILEQKVAQGKLGRKTGEGFYKWQGDKRL